MVICYLFLFALSSIRDYYRLTENISITLYSGLQLCTCKVVYVMRACSVDGILVRCMTLFLMSIEIWNLCAK